MTKSMLCACEDVTAQEVARAFAAGHRDLESVKRYTGFGTGPCQGRSCTAIMVRELLRLGATPAEIQPFTARPPMTLVPLGLLASIDPAGLSLTEDDLLRMYRAMRLARTFETRLAEGAVWCGDPKHLIEQIEEFDHAVGGVDYASIQVNFHTMEVARAEANLRLFAEEVMPHFAKQRVA